MSACRGAEKRSVIRLVSGTTLTPQWGVPNHENLITKNTKSTKDTKKESGILGIIWVMLLPALGGCDPLTTYLVNGSGARVTVTLLRKDGVSTHLFVEEGKPAMAFRFGLDLNGQISVQIMGSAPKIIYSGDFCRPPEFLLVGKFKAMCVDAVSSST